MSTTTLYGFLYDDAFRSSSMLGFSSKETPIYGILSGEAANYFNNKVAIRDSRKTRLRFLDDTPPSGSMEVLFDADQYDTDSLSGMTDVENALLFNIMELMTYRGEYADTEIEAMLVNTAEYRGYVANTFIHSIGESEAAVTDAEKNQYNVKMYDWISFKFKTENVDITIHLWHSRSAFASDYPYTTITAVLSPYSPTQLADTTTMLDTGAFTMLTAGSDYLFSQFDVETAARDQNGIYTYKTKYVLSATQTVQLPFALAYRGPRVPSTLECRKAIKEYLEDNSALAADAFTTIFPELYVNSRFFIVPLWDTYEAYSDRDIFASIQNVKHILSVAELFFSTTDADFRSNYLEIMTQAQSKMMMISLPDELNDSIFSIRELHPTYQDYSSQQTGWKYLTSDTQEFAGKIVRCLATLLGESEDTGEFIQTEISDMTYWAFTSGVAEYLILDQTSYTEFTENLTI